MAAKAAEEYNEDELDPPKWLDSKFFKKVLMNEEKGANDIEVKDFEIAPATIKGDHYASVMFRAVVIYRLNGAEISKSMIIKTMPEIEGVKKDMLEKFGTFGTEIGMYVDVLPRFEKYLREVGDQTKLMARVLYHELSPHKLIIFEDIVPLGYTVLRDRLPNEEDAMAALTKLAKWHAVSHKILSEEPTFFENYRTTYFTRDNINKMPFTMNCVATFMKMLHKTPELQKYVPRFEKLIAKVDLLEESFKSFEEYLVAPHPNAYYVLNHGDFHSKNLMFKYNSGNKKLEDVMLLDFQFCHVGPPTSDLLYSIYMLLNSELRLSTWEFLWHYFNIFRETLEKIGFKGSLPTKTKFQEQIEDHKYLELFLMVGFLPIWPKLTRGEVSVESLSNDPEFGRAIFEDREYIDELLVIIPKYLNMGYLDI